MWVTSEAIVIDKLWNPSHSVLVGIVRVFGSNFKAFKFSIRIQICMKTTLCHDWLKSQHALLIFEFFLTPSPIWDFQVTWWRWITRFLFIMMIRGLSSTYFWYLLYIVGMVFLVLSFAQTQFYMFGWPHVKV